MHRLRHTTTITRTDPLPHLPHHPPTHDGGIRPMTAVRRRHKQPDICTLLGLILTGLPRIPEAACKDLPHLFDASTPADTQAAITICNACPELQPCRQWLDTQPKAHRPLGVTAGRHIPERHR